MANLSFIVSNIAVLFLLSQLGSNASFAWGADSIFNKPVVLLDPNDIIVSAQMQMETQTKKAIEPMDHSSHQQVIEELTQTPRVAFEIRVKLFPLEFVLPGDPWKNTQDRKHLHIFSGNILEAMDQMGNSVVLAKDFKFDFENHVILADTRTLPLKPLKIRLSPVFKKCSDDLGSNYIQVSWDEGTPYHSATVVRGIVEVLLDSHPHDSAQSHSSWIAVNQLHLNEYLFSVVPSEMPTQWQQQALYAQAIAARTYGLYEVMEARKLKNRNWDVDPTTWFQVYRGMYFFDSKNDRWIQMEALSSTHAVLGTGMQIMSYSGEIIKSYFSSNSGGITCSASECFGLNDSKFSYLKSIQDHISVVDVSPTGTWGDKAKISQQTIYEKLVAMGIPSYYSIKKLRSYERGPSGRTWRLAIEYLNHPDLILSRSQTKEMLTLFGPIRSQLFTLGEMDELGNQSVMGHGYGHGVGMSQWGAELFARSGWTFKQILNWYYSNIEFIY